MAYLSAREYSKSIYTLFPRAVDCPINFATFFQKRSFYEIVQVRINLLTRGVFLLSLIAMRTSPPSMKLHKYMCIKDFFWKKKCIEWLHQLLITIEFKMYLVHPVGDFFQFIKIWILLQKFVRPDHLFVQVVLKNLWLFHEEKLFWLIKCFSK